MDDRVRPDLVTAGRELLHLRRSHAVRLAQQPGDDVERGRDAVRGEDRPHGVEVVAVAVVERHGDHALLESEFGAEDVVVGHEEADPLDQVVHLHAGGVGGRGEGGGRQRPVGRGGRVRDEVVGDASVGADDARVDLAGNVGAIPGGHRVHSRRRDRHRRGRPVGGAVGEGGDADARRVVAGAAGRGDAGGTDVVAVAGDLPAGRFAGRVELLDARVGNEVFDGGLRRRGNQDHRRREGEGCAGMTERTTVHRISRVSRERLHRT